MLRRKLRLLVTAFVVSTSQILVILMMEAIRSFEISDFIRSTWRNFTEDVILQVLPKAQEYI
jgi:hypothetical protein